MWAGYTTIAKGLARGRQAGISIRLEDRGAGMELGISGVIGHPNSLAAGDCDTAGQCVEDIAAIPASKLVDGWDADKLDRLVSVWRRWHLNRMQAGCEHQTALYYHEGQRFEVGDVCPVCGYSWGHAWNSEELPAAVLAFVETL